MRMSVVKEYYHKARAVALISIWVLLWLALFLNISSPIVNTVKKATLVICVIGIWVVGAAIFWNKKAARLVILAIGIIPVLFLSMPGYRYDKALLRQEYVNELSKYENVNYVWGGEKRSGIDCSGLIRAGLMNANIRQGIIRLNPRLVRTGIYLWWNDSSAYELGSGYKNRTKRIAAIKDIDDVDYSTIRPGDFVVKADGTHTMAYLSDNIWIEADPEMMKVIKEKIPGSKSWKGTPVYVMRWHQLE
jgi:NlpC/P60 family